MRRWWRWPRNSAEPTCESASWRVSPINCTDPVFRVGVVVSLVSAETRSERRVGPSDHHKSSFTRQAPVRTAPPAAARDRPWPLSTRPLRRSGCRDRIFGKDRLDLLERLLGGGLGGHGGGVAHASFTYSKSPGLLSMPERGGAIHEANAPASRTGRIRLATKALSSAVGRNSSRRRAHYAAPRMSPLGSASIGANSPIRRLNATCGRVMRKSIPARSMMRFHQRSTAEAASAT